MQEHAADIVGLLWIIVGVQTAAIIAGLKLWFFDLKEWKKTQECHHKIVLERIEKLRVAADEKVERLGMEVHDDIAKLGERIAHIEGWLERKKMAANSLKKMDDTL